jgi:hypothetical protein
MPLNPVEMLPDHWADFPAPRQPCCDDHPLLHRLCLSLCAVLWGAEPCLEMEAFGQAKVAWLCLSLDLSRGLPSPDTVNCTGAVWDGSKACGIWASQSGQRGGSLCGACQRRRPRCCSQPCGRPGAARLGCMGVRGGQARCREAGPQGPRRCAAGPLASDDAQRAATRHICGRRSPCQAAAGRVGYQRPGQTAGPGFARILKVFHSAEASCIGAGGRRQWVGRINGLFAPHPASLPAPPAGDPAVPAAHAAA